MQLIVNRLLKQSSTNNIACFLLYFPIRSSLLYHLIFVFQYYTSITFSLISITLYFIFCSLTYFFQDSFFHSIFWCIDLYYVVDVVVSVFTRFIQFFLYFIITIFFPSLDAIMCINLLFS